jgi:hypothetical protein
VLIFGIVMTNDEMAGGVGENWLLLLWLFILVSECLLCVSDHYHCTFDISNPKGLNRRLSSDTKITVEPAYKDMHRTRFK